MWNLKIMYLYQFKGQPANNFKQKVSFYYLKSVDDPVANIKNDVF